jgi:hypothetical protein
MKKAKNQRSARLKPINSGDQIQVDLKNATQKVCTCGCTYFLPVVSVFTVSALASPTGQEIAAHKPALICMECRELLE